MVYDKLIKILWFQEINNNYFLRNVLVTFNKRFTIYINYFIMFTEGGLFSVYNDIFIYDRLILKFLWKVTAKFVSPLTQNSCSNSVCISQRIVCFSKLKL